MKSLSLRQSPPEIRDRFVRAKSGRIYAQYYDRPNGDWMQIRPIPGTTDFKWYGRVYNSAPAGEQHLQQIRIFH